MIASCVFRADEVVAMLSVNARSYRSRAGLDRTSAATGMYQIAPSAPIGYLCAYH